MVAALDRIAKGGHFGDVCVDGLLQVGSFNGLAGSLEILAGPNFLGGHADKISPASGGLTPNTSSLPT